MATLIKQKSSAKRRRTGNQRAQYGFAILPIGEKLKNKELSYAKH